MDKKILLLILCILLSGCSTAGGGGTRDVGENFRTGTQGLVMSYYPSLPPDKILASSSVNIMVEMYNRGAYNVENGYIYLSGYDRRYFFGSEQVSQAINLEGKSAYNPEGSLKQIAEFKDASIDNIPEDIDSFRQTFKVTACYYYETVANPEICINSKQYTTDAAEQICQIHPVSLSGGQGAPIEIVKVEEELMDNKILLKGYVKNSGTGTPFSSGVSLTDCHLNLQYNDIDMIDIEEVRFSEYDLTSSCRPNPIRLVQGSGFFVCNYDLGSLGNNAFETPLRIKLGYNYRDSITKTVDIVNI